MVSPVTTVVMPWCRIVLGLFLVVTPAVSWITPHSVVHRIHTTRVITGADTGSSLTSSSSPVRHGVSLYHRTHREKEVRLFSASYSNDNMPDEASLRRAYDSWRDFYSNPNLRTSVARTVSPEFDSLKFQHFKDNFVALKQANYKAWLKATSNNQIPPPPLQLNEFGDCSAEEYQRIVNGGSSSSTTSRSSTPSTSTWSSYNNNNNNNKQNAPIPTQVNSKTLTPPPTATPWAGSTGSTSRSATTNYNDSKNVNSDNYSNNYNSNGNLNKMDPSTSYQLQSDGTYSYVPSRNQNMDDTKPIPRSRPEDARSPYGTVGGNPTTSSTSTDPASMAAYNGSSGSGSVSSYSGMYGTARDQGPPSPLGPMGEWNSGPTYPGSGGGASSSSSPFPFNGDPYGGSTTSTNGAYMGPGGGGGGPSDNGSSSSSSSYWSSSSSRGPPSPSSVNGEGRNGYYGYDTVAGGANSGPLYGDPTINGSGGYGGMSGYPNEATPPPSSPPPPILTPDEQAALDRARSRHDMIPKAVFDEDESEDENTDNSWANFGMPKVKKIRREKMDLPPPIINGVGNGGMIGVGRNMGNRPSTSFGTSNNNMKSNPSSSQVVGNSYSDIRKVGTSFNGGASNTNTNTYLQDRIRDAYQDWCNNHGKPFEEYRLPIFQKNYLEMEKYSQETGIPLQQLNKYADLSPEEFKAVKTPPSRHNNRNNNNDVPDWIQETPESKLESKEEFLNFGPRWGKDPPKESAPRDMGGTSLVDPMTGAKRDFQGEQRLRMAYQEWCQQNNKVFDEARLPIFTSNLVAMEQYCLTQNMPMKPLNAYADLSPAEFQAAIAAEKEQPRFGDSTATMSSFPGGNGNGGDTMASGMPPRMPPGMGVMAPPPYDIGPGPPGMGMYGGSPYRDEPPASQLYDAGLGYGSAMAPGGTNNGGSMPSSGQGGTIPPVNIATSGRTTTTAAVTERATAAGGATPLAETRRTKPTEAEFKRNAEARLKAFTEAKNRRRGDGDARVKRFAELKQQVALVAKEQNVTIEEATQLVFANATMSPLTENVTLSATNSKEAASNETIAQTPTAALQEQEDVDEDDDFDEEEDDLDEDATQSGIADAAMSLASKIVSPSPLTESTANVTLSATNVKEAATIEMIPQNSTTVLQAEDDVDDNEDDVDDNEDDVDDVDDNEDDVDDNEDDVDENEDDVDDNKDDVDEDVIPDDELTTKLSISTGEGATKETAVAVQAMEIPTNATSNVTSAAVVEITEMPANDTTNAAIAAAVETTDIPNAIQEQVDQQEQLTTKDLALVDGVTDVIQDQVETEQPSSKHRAVVDLSAVLSIEKNSIQTETPQKKKEPKKSKGERRKEGDNGSHGSRSYVHAETRHQHSVAKNESVAGSGGDAKESDQMKRAQAAKNKYSAQIASLDSDSGTEQSLLSADLSSPKEVIDAKSPPVKTPEEGDIVAEKEALSSPLSSFFKSNSSTITESETSTIGEEEAKVETTLVKAVTSGTIPDEDEGSQVTEMLVESASMKHEKVTSSTSFRRSDSSANTESETSTSREEVVEIEVAPVSAVTPATISDQDETSQETELMVKAELTNDENDVSSIRPESPDNALDERSREEAKLKAEMEVIQEKLKVFEIARKKAEAEAKEKAAEASRLREAMKAKHLAAQEAQEKSEAEKGDKTNKQVSDEGTVENSKEAQAEKDLFKKLASDVSSMFRDLQK